MEYSYNTASYMELSIWKSLKKGGEESGGTKILMGSFRSPIFGVILLFVKDYFFPLPLLFYYFSQKYFGCLIPVEPDKSPLLFSQELILEQNLE